MKPKTKQTTEPPPGTSEAADNQDITPEGVTHTAGVTHTELAAENEQLKATLRTERAHRQITGELAAAGARSPELLFDAIKGELQFDGEGTVANAAATVGKLKASFPEQFGTPTPASIDAGAGVRPAPQLTREALAKMKPAEIAALDWNDVRRVLSV